MTEVHETTQARIAWLEELREQALHAGSEKTVRRRREEGRLLARERAERLCDPGSFVELDRYVRHREWNFGMMLLVHVHHRPRRRDAPNLSRSATIGDARFLCHVGRASAETGDKKEYPRGYTLADDRLDGLGASSYR